MDHNGLMWTHQKSSMFITIVTLCHFGMCMSMCRMKRPEFIFCVKHRIETIHCETLRNFTPYTLHGFIVMQDETEWHRERRPWLNG